MAKAKKVQKSASSKGRGTMQDLVYQELRRSLMMGVFEPGEKVSLRDLAEQMGTSMMPIREAVNRLIAERAFDVLPSRMAVVPLMTHEKFEEIVHWRIRLETEATKKACANITPQIIAELEAINQKMIDSNNGNAQESLAWNYEFHFNIYRASKSEILLPMIESLWLQVGPFTSYSIPSPGYLWDARHHFDAIAALKKKDAEAVGQAIANDIEATAKFLRQNGYYKPVKVRRVV